MTRTKIIDAAKNVYDIVGRDRFDTNLVAAHAGLSIGTIYRYFENRIDLMDAVYPDRDYPTLVLLDKVERWVQGDNSIYDISVDSPKAIVKFLEEAL